jgi:hypothetical protein
VGGFNKPGLPGLPGDGSPPDTTGTIGPSSFVQLVNNKPGIFDRTTGALISSGTLDDLANISSSVHSFDPAKYLGPFDEPFLLHDDVDLLGHRR